MPDEADTAPTDKKPEEKPVETTEEKKDEHPDANEAAAAEPEPKGVAAMVEAVKGEAAPPAEAGTDEVKAEPPKPGFFFPDLNKVKDRKPAGPGPDLHPPAKSEAAPPEQEPTEPEEPTPQDVQRPPPQVPKNAKAPPQPSSKKKPAKPVDIGGDYVAGGLFDTTPKDGAPSYGLLLDHLNPRDLEIIKFMGKYLTFRNYIVKDHPLLVAKFALNFLYQGIKDELGQGGQ